METRYLNPNCTQNASQDASTQVSCCAANAELRVISSHDLFQGQRCIAIEHDANHYVLRITRTGKLILTK